MAQLRDRAGAVILVNNQDEEVLIASRVGRVVTPSWDSGAGSLSVPKPSGDATTDSTNIKAAVNSAAALSIALGTRYQVVFAAGVYLINVDGVLTPDSGNNMPGIDFRGAGMAGATTLRLVAGGTPLYFYNNGAVARTNFSSFSDIRFQGMDPAAFATYADIPDNARGIRTWATAATGSHEQGFRFTRCQFAYLHTVFSAAGDQTASEIKWTDCRIAAIKNTVYDVNNVQSFNHEFHGTDIEVIYGDVFSIGALGGGAIKMFGGSVILDSSTGVDHYFFKNAGSSGPGANPFVFTGVRFEFRGNFANIANVGHTLQADLTFYACEIQTTSTANLANFCKVGAYSGLLFHRCTFYEQNAGQFQFHCTSTAGFGQNGTITFSRCALPVDWSDRCTVDVFHGRITAVDCYGTNVGAPAAGAHWAHDFDLHWNEANPGQVATWAGSGGTLRSDASPTDGGLRLKAARIKLPTEFWPSNTEHTLKLPKNAIIKNIHLRKPAGGADATVTTKRVGKNDKSADHLVTAAVADNTVHTGDVTNYFYHVGASTNERTLRLYSSAATTNALQGGLVIVEYY